MYTNLFSKITIKGLTLKNRLIMAPLYLGYADILHCNPDCGDACTQMVMKGRPAYCVQWPPEKIKAWKSKFI